MGWKSYAIAIKNINKNDFKVVNESCSRKKIDLVYDATQMMLRF